MEKEQENKISPQVAKNEDIPPLSPLIKGGAESGGINSPIEGGAESGGINSPIKGGAESGGINSPIKGGAESGGINSPTEGGAESGGIISPIEGGAESGGIISPIERGAESEGLNSSKLGTECGGIAYFDKDSVQKRGLTWNGSHLPYNSNNVDKARTMRKEMTPAEKKLWYGFLRNFKYRVLRQRPIDHYIADFYCAKLKLVIELDGKHHLDSLEYDKNRTNILQVYGLRILRFTNEQILSDFTNVCKVIEEIPPLSPLIKGGAESGGINSPNGGAESRGFKEKNVRY